MYSASVQMWGNLTLRLWNADKPHRSVSCPVISSNLWFCQGFCQFYKFRNFAPWDAKKNDILLHLNPALKQKKKTKKKKRKRNKVPHTGRQTDTLTAKHTNTLRSSLLSVNAGPIMCFMICGQRRFSDNHPNELGLLQIQKASPLEVSLVNLCALVCVCVCLRITQRQRKKAAV